MTGNSKAWLGGFGELGHPVDVTSIPSGIIAMWSGASNTIPTGWLLCNGSNGTPDLRDRFIVGAGSSYTVGTTGGSNTVTLTTAQMPSHNHTFTGTSHTHTLNLSGLTCSSAGEHNHTVSIGSHPQAASVSNYLANAPTNTSTKVFTTSTNGSHTHSISGTGSINNTTAGGSIGNTGSDNAHENRPPYYAMCFIMKS